jgi:hypothetical protein
MATAELEDGDDMIKAEAVSCIAVLNKMGSPAAATPAAFFQAGPATA